jgi:putative membrane protein
MLNLILLSMAHYGGIAVLILALCVEYLLFRRGLNMLRVYRLLLADGVAALALFSVFATGCLLALEHANSVAQIFVHPAHGLKMGLFLLIVGSLDYPSRLFYRWRRSLRQGRAPMISIQQQFRVVWILRGNLVLVALLALLTKPPLL